ncbi:MAG: hypothetical protein ACXV5E_08675 [Halobacteriota archaeon]
MLFREIVILAVDYTHVDELGSGNEVVAPFILSDTPPEEWKQYFEDHAPPNTVIVGNIIRYQCPNDKAALQRYGRCWNTVADLIDDANRYYLGVELRKWQELGREAEKESKKGSKEEEPSEFEKEWGRYMGRD